MVKKKNAQYVDSLKLEFKGWTEGDEQYTNIPEVCPECGSKLMRTDAIKLIGLLWAGCTNRKCRWCEIYEQRE